MSAPRPQRSDFAAFRQIQTRWMDNDVYGHMNNVVHYSLFDTAVNGWLIEQGLLDVTKSQTYGLVVETGCRYYAEMQFPDLVHAGLLLTPGWAITQAAQPQVNHKVGPEQALLPAKGPQTGYTS